MSNELNEKITILNSEINLLKDNTKKLEKELISLIKKVRK